MVPRNFEVNAHPGHGTKSTWPTSVSRIRFATNTSVPHCTSRNSTLFCTRSQNRARYQGCRPQGKSLPLRQKSILTNTVSRVFDIPRSFVVWLMTDMVVDQAVKKMSMCQHRKSVVARMAFQKVELNDLSCVKGVMEN